MTLVAVGDRLVPMPELGEGDRLLPVYRTGDLLVVPRAEHEITRDAVDRAHVAFRAMTSAPAEAVSSFLECFASRLADDRVWGGIADANLADVELAKAAGRSTTRLVATEKMRTGMVDGLRAWAAAPDRRGEVVERREQDDWTIERRRAPLGVVAFVFEGRPNVFADGAGVLRNGNTSVMRIGSDALGTAIAIEETSIAPALEAAGLPAGAITLVRSRAHAAAHALFTMAEVRLAIARGSGPAVALLGSIAEQHGIPASLHGTGGGWLYIAGDADAETARNAIANSIDRKVCNTLNVLLVAQRRAHDLAPLLSDVLCGARVHVVVDSKEFFAHGDVIGVDDLATEWEWEDVPELSLCVVRDDDEAADLVNRYSPRLVASIVTPDRERFERFYERVDTPYVGHGFTRWVDGQWAWGRPELGLTNWERGRLLGRSGILSGDDVFTVRDVWIDRSGKATQRR